MADRPPSTPGDAQAEARAARDHLRQHMSADDPADVAMNAVDELAEQANELDRLREENRQLQTQLADAQDQLLRRAAEFQNYRRRSEGDRALAEERGREAVLLPLLDVYDDLRRSLDAARRASKQDHGSPSFEALSQGVELVYRKFEDALQKIGVEPIETAGQPFDEAVHEAVMQQPGPEGTASGDVIAEVQRGYRRGDRVLRHARVIVAQ